MKNVKDSINAQGLRSWGSRNGVHVQFRNRRDHVDVIFLSDDSSPHSQKV